MRILPIGTSLYHRTDLQNNNNILQTNHAKLYTYKDAFSFGANYRSIVPIKTIRDFKHRAIERGGYHCMYCNIPMKYDEVMFNTWKNNNMFSLPINAFVQLFKPYKECLHKSEREIFEFVEHISNKSPQAKLDTVIKIMSVKANTKLFKDQKPLFDLMAKEAAKLPEENQKAILALIAKSECRILKIPHTEEFSGKETKYKIENLAKTLSDPRLTKRINSLAELLTIPAIYKQTEPLTDKIVLRILKTISPNAKINKTTNIHENYSPKRLNSLIIQAIKSEVKNYKRKDIYNLCIEADKMINGEPIIGKFTNRSFVYDLKEAMEGVAETSKVRSKIFEHANNLPTSSDNVYAFIAKHDQSSPEKIAYDLFTPSELTLEHQNPTSLGGTNLIINWAMACKRCNNTRQHKDMGIFYKRFDKKNAQKYWNEIIADANKGYFDFEDVVGMLRIFKQQSGIKIQSKHLKFRPPFSE